MAGGEYADGLRVKLDKLLAKSGLSESVSDGLRKIKQKAVRINNELKEDPVLVLKDAAELTVRVGRKLKRVRLRR